MTSLSWLEIRDVSRLDFALTRGFKVHLFQVFSDFFWFVWASLVRHQSETLLVSVLYVDMI